MDPYPYADTFHRQCITLLRIALNLTKNNVPFTTHHSHSPAACSTISKTSLGLRPWRDLNNYAWCAFLASKFLYSNDPEQYPITTILPIDFTENVPDNAFRKKMFFFSISALIAAQPIADSVSSSIVWNKNHHFVSNCWNGNYFPLSDASRFSNRFYKKFIICSKIVYAKEGLKDCPTPSPASFRLSVLHLHEQHPCSPHLIQPSDVRLLVYHQFCKLV